ncbi:MAG: site-2 protease family protein [Pyrinomonadaceae bacterium]|nr:site-2 protease family protein [Pyrinomonadaceae bacterium]
MNFFQFFRRQIEVARVIGIPVRIDYRWFFVFAITVWLMAKNVPQHRLENDPFVAILLGTATTIAFFLSIFGHELAHAVAARMENIQTLEIVLHPFGGLARLQREPETARAEFRIAIAGPAASFLFGIFFLLLASAARTLELPAIATMLFVLFFGNILLAVFNLFPGYPLDGGRVLRAFLWSQGYELNEATRITGRCGQLIAVVLVVFGLFVAILREDLFAGLWTVLVGLFLFDAAAGIVKHTFTVEKITVGEVMSTPITLKPETPISQFVDSTLTLHRNSVFPVAENKRLHGIFLLEDLKKLPRESWYKTPIRQIMRPVQDDFFASISMRLSEAREIMRENGVESLAVIDDEGLLIGFLQRGKIRKKA